MANARRGISDLLRSGKGKRFRSSGYDLLADGEDLVRSDRDEDEDSEPVVKGPAARDSAQVSSGSRKPVVAKSTSNSASATKSRQGDVPAKTQSRAGASSRDDVVKGSVGSSKHVVAKADTSAKSAIAPKKAMVAKSATPPPKKVVAEVATVPEEAVVTETATVAKTDTISGDAGRSPTPQAQPRAVVAKTDTVPKTETTRSVNAWLPSGRMMVSQTATVAKTDTTSHPATGSQFSNQRDGVGGSHSAVDKMVADSATIAETDTVSNSATTSVQPVNHGVRDVVAKTATEPSSVLAGGNAAIRSAETRRYDGDEGQEVRATVDGGHGVATSATIASPATADRNPSPRPIVSASATTADSATVSESATTGVSKANTSEGVVAKPATIAEDVTSTQSGYSSHNGYHPGASHSAQLQHDRVVPKSDTIANSDTVYAGGARAATHGQHGAAVVAESATVAERASGNGHLPYTGAPGFTAKVSQGGGIHNGYHSQNGSHPASDNGMTAAAAWRGPETSMVTNSAMISERATAPGRPSPAVHAGVNPNPGFNQVVAKSAIVSGSATSHSSGGQYRDRLVSETATVAKAATPQPRAPSQSAHAQLERTQQASPQSSFPEQGLLPLPFWVLRMIRQDELSMREIRVFLTILEECVMSGTGSAEISANDLMTRTQIHRTHIFSSVKGLLEKNLIVKDKTDVASKNVYRMNFNVGLAT